jgi:peroxiredoxin Q/BCP
MPDAPGTGDRAPDFTLASTDGELRLSDLLSRGRLVLAFYFEDATPSCQTELMMLRDAHELIAGAGASILAVSADSVDSHRAFVERLGGVPFPLASDESLSSARAYGVVDEGDPRRSRRAVFVIDRDGTVLVSLPHFQPNNLLHVEAIVSALAAT